LYFKVAGAIMAKAKRGMFVGNYFKNAIMTYKEELEELHTKSLSKFAEYLEKKTTIAQEENEKLLQQKTEWEQAWNKLMETILVLERLEI
jgi:hypothetical protein